MYVYRTPSFNEELKTSQDLLSRVDNLCSSLEMMSVLKAQERFKRIHSYLKRKEGKFRVIAKLIKVEKEQILCLLKAYRRGEPDYRHFLELVKHKNDLFQESSLRGELVTWLQEQQANLPLVTTNILDDDLRIWLQRPNWNLNHDGIIIHESKLWEQQFNQTEIRSQALIYRQLIEDLINNFNQIGEETHWSQVRLYGKENCHIIYSNILTKDQPSEQVLLLIAPLLKKSNQDTLSHSIDSLLKQDRDFNWWQKQHNLYLDDLITYTKRSYPWYLISDENFWLRLQDGNQVNLALSQEEKDILVTVAHHKSLPLFLNGRAGSGKSTMLFHLFAYYCHRHLQFCTENQQDILAKPHPLFITYSPNLSDFAKVKVQSILKYHHYFLVETNKSDRLKDLSVYFQSFRYFLLKLLPVSVRAKFTAEKYISFHHFKELCKERWHNISAEKCWLVIQNFIKGYEFIDKDSYLDSEAKYQQIPNKEKTVSVAEFIEIKEKVWHWYYKYTQEHNFWDDRDLVRTILDLKCYQAEYTVIFCDEAQDFTRLELQLIMGLSVFSLYNLEQETIFSLPFAFAGDPLQTLNPSGFRWAGFKAAFYNQILTPLGLAEQPQLTLELKQLRYNYRSAAAIVKINNLIQLWRKILCDFSEVEPQKAKKYNNLIPQKFILGQNITLEELQHILKDKIILIPCNEGAEAEFIKQDELLQNLSQKQANPWNILSAISAKGLEFSQVVMYRFGEACPLNLGDLPTETTEEDKYFFNKLYVAASRATEKLFIIDSLEGEIKLWSYASDRNFLDEILNKIEDNHQKQQWQENVDLIYLGHALSDISDDDVEANALMFETVGISSQNIDFLTRAIAAYQEINNQFKANFCLAWKLNLEQDFLAAGNLFLSLNKVGEAVDCFWQAQEWQQLKQLLIKYKSKVNQEHDFLQYLSPVINFMVDFSLEATQKSEIKATENIIKITNFLNQELNQNNLDKEKESKSWQVFFAVYCQQIQNLLSNHFLLESKYWQTISNILISYLETNTLELNLLIIQCLYCAQDYQRLIDYWEDLEDESLEFTREQAKYYYLAQAKIAKLPEGLKYLLEGKQYQTIIKLWLKTGSTSEKNWLQYVAPALEALGKYHNAINLYCQLNDSLKIQQCWQNITEQQVKEKVAIIIINYHCQQQLWEQAITFVQTEVTSFKIQCYFLFALANSNLQATKLNKSQRQNYQQLGEKILNNTQWQKYLTVNCVGIALEKIGSFNSTLAFYEQYLNASEPEIQQFARDRWSVVKQKQIDYFRAKVKLSKVQKSQQQLTTRLKQWKINLQNIPSQPNFPISLLTKPVTSLKTNNNNNDSETPNFLQPTKIPTSTTQIKQLQFNHLLLRISASNQKLAIIDLLHHKKILLDWRSGKVQLETTTLILSGNQPLLFADTLGQYKGILWRDLNPRLELKLNNYPQVIKIKFNNL